MSLKNQMIELKSALEKRAAQLLHDQQISFSESKVINNECQKILDFAAKLNSIELNQVLTDINEPAKKIIEATNSLDKAAAKIQEAQKFFEILSPLIRLGEAVSKAIANPTSVAAIGTLVTELKDIGDRLNT
ncbi:hypothetical protein [Nostoc sp.]|uniref:hypothetical protein n=1 Tax=Nostoc sp. TaxID=1180 RepID=UPI002FF84911